ncbi:MAG TPA: asparagine synthase (glutamine-hydrolyzing) [Oligoflexia bacterium]|nr:asparagine synthase (glutamine-hydrolyzing) [Oligoflexia bacterium]HMP48560.1 asparagine synthase (glutamine-hydrolyzing) [Oligoflexia bacterium]
MCGIAGFIDSGHFLPSDDWEKTLESMGHAISHRGPDDSGVWMDKDAGIGLSHRRLSILDISSAGHQPMISHSGRFVIIFNGEIYNHLKIREELSGINWRGHSDTETLLAGIDAWGLEETLKRSVGMFALAVWDREERILRLSRDRMGEKPLYFGWQGNVFLFGSELKALRKHPAFLAEINLDAISEFLTLSSIPAPLSIYKGISKLTPGHILEISLGANKQEKEISFWSLRKAIENGKRNPFLGKDLEGVLETERILRESVRSQLISDVPLGAFLSGGVDSSLIVSLMQQESSKPVRTFTIGFIDARYDEAEYARTVAEHLGTEHTDEYVTAKDALEIIPRLPEIYDEPFADSSQIPTYLLSAITSRNVTVSLSGDGGDELFGGYNRHSYLPSLHNIPYIFRKILSYSVSGVSNRLTQDIYLKTLGLFTKKHPSYGVAHQVQKLASVLSAKSFDEMYVSLQGERCGEKSFLLSDIKKIKKRQDDFCSDNLSELVMYKDSLGYLPDDILVKVDRASMATSIETRAPFLDYRLVEFAWSLPLSMKIRGKRGKWVLREILRKYVPDSLIDRPKMGFSVPIAEWLRGPLRPWAEELLDVNRMGQDGFFNSEMMQKMWGEHLREEFNWGTQLWSVLMFQAWLRSGGNCRRR